MAETNTDSNETADQTFFEPVGQAVAQVATEDDDNTVKKTGASDSEGNPVQEVQSLCMRCGKQGTTRILLTSIPYFRETIIMSFECPHCGFKNSEVQAASEIQEKGTRYVLKVEQKEDFDRQVIKSDNCSCKFLELDVEIPAKRGQLTTVEGLLSEMVADLEMDQERRKTEHPEDYANIDKFVNKVKGCLTCEPGTLPLTLVADDPSGNSWIEYKPGEPQHKWSCTQYVRTPEQNVALGLVSADEVAQNEIKQKENEKEATEKETANEDEGVTSYNYENPEGNPEEEMQVFKAPCSSCGAPSETHMKMVSIPHFKDVILMSTVCDKCGYKSNEVKTGGEIPAKGKRIALKCTDPEDLARDILKSETCSLEVPELGLDVNAGTLGGRFTTIEGLLREVKDGLYSKVFTETSDSMDNDTKLKWKEFFDKMDRALAGKLQFTIMMEDPLAGSYIQNVYAPDPDPNMASEEYERTSEQEQDLGLADMKV
ncbi:DEKNAAC103364 [Brettanomyces naardenensis]|uniref:DEKNAAC103364 n=1 Tax=Brettanomyces naardenensis TaxID=13370 RepID=A0A448YNX4_BRENA|nr:DEKNAAC103364 [Brettanomyces naardenensis]